MRIEGMSTSVARLLVGHVAFSPVSDTRDDRWSAYILAPLGILPQWQRRGVGSKLVAAGMQRLRAEIAAIGLRLEASDEARREAVERTDPDEIDPLSGTAVLSGVPVRVERCDPD